MIEVELKFPLEDVDSSRIVLQKLGFVIDQKRGLEINTMFDNKSGLMQQSNGRIRLRKTIKGVEFCYKLPLVSEGIKRELELEVELSDYAIMESILEKMEYTPTTGYERYRTILSKDGVKVTIDEFPFASFLEIEGDEENIISVAGEIGFDLKDNLMKPCDTLFSEWREERGLPFKPYMRFEDYDK